MATPDHRDTICVRTCINTLVPRGSFLSYQMPLVESNFNVQCHEPYLDTFNCTENCPTADLTYPDMPLASAYDAPNLEALSGQDKEYV